MILAGEPPISVLDPGPIFRSATRPQATEFYADLMRPTGAPEFFGCLPLAYKARLCSTYPYPLGGIPN